MRTIGLLDWFRTEGRSQEQTLDGSQLDTALRAALGGSAVTVRSVLNIPAVSGSVGFIAGTVASLPIRLYRNENGRSEEVTDDYRLRLLNEETGDLLDAFQWKCTLVRDYLLPGNGYTYVDWVSNRIDGLYYVDPMQVSAEIGADPIFKTARFFIGGRSYCEYEVMRILRNTREGVTGSGLVAESPIQLETMLNALKYENRMVKTGAKKGFLKVEKDKKVSQTVLDQLRNSWRKMYGPDSEETTVILNDGVDFKDAGQTAVETQLNENKQTNAHEIYRIFNIAPTVLEGDATAEDLKNTVRFAIAPVVKALQLAINRFCLLEAEKGVLAFEIDMDALDGTDMLARYQAYEVAIRNGWIKCDMLNWTNTYGKPDHTNHAKALAMLQAGYYLIALMNKGLWTSSGHFVVVWWADNKIHINDPASTRKVRTEGDPGTFRSQVKYYWWVDARAYNQQKEAEEDVTHEEWMQHWYELRKSLQDNDSSAYSEEARKWAQEVGLITGNGTEIDGEPNCMWEDVLTREQFATVLYRFAKIIGKA